MLVRCHGKEFDVYKESEASKLGIKFSKDWRDSKKGDWIVTSGGDKVPSRVVQVVDRKVWKRTGNQKPRIFIRTGYGDTTIAKKHIYAYKTTNYSRDKRKQAGYRPVKNTRPTTCQQIFLDYLAEIGSPTHARGKILWDSDSIITAYQMAYSDNNENQALQRGYHILNKKFSKEYMSKLMKEQFDEIGLNDEYVADKYKNFLEDGKVPHSVRLSALNRISELRGHNNIERQQETQTVVMLTKSEDDRKMLAEARKIISDKQVNIYMEEARKKVEADNPEKRV